jgi:hypothetical protein
MVRSLCLSIVLGVGVLLGSATSHAQTLRIPKVGDPALSVNATAGWTSSYDQSGNLQLFSSDHSVMLQLSVSTGSFGAGATLNTLNTAAADIFKSAGAQPYSKSEQSTLAGQMGMAYYGALNEPNMVLNLKVILVELDSSHIISASTLASQSATAAQLAALNTLVGSVKLIK